MPQGKKYWLVKTEPETYSIADLAKDSNQTTSWDGVRNYQARNFMRDDMKLGDGVLFYHSSTDTPAIMGVATIVRESYPDSTAWDAKNPHFDPKSKPDNPRWFMVDLKLKQIFNKPLPLDQLRGTASLAKMELLRKGSRLSVQPVRESEFKAILKLAAKR